MMTFRQILLLASLCVILITSYVTVALTRGIGPQFLVDIYQPVKFIGFVNDCPEMVLTLNGRRLRLLYQAYSRHTTEGEAEFVIAAYTREEDWPQESKLKICSKLDSDANRLE
jgi:hypothetical protein